MQKILIEMPEIKLVGITARTSNVAEFNPQTAKIGNCITEYFTNQISNQIANRKSPGVTFCAYTEYESDYTGEYTYFVGEEVSEAGEIPEGLTLHIIPAQKYAKFTTNSGIMPDICINAWQQIWQMNDQQLSGKRNYHTDFEVYDERAMDKDNTVLDIYIGLEK